MLVLAIDASTYTGSVALIRGNQLVAESTAAMRGEDEERLLPSIVSVLDRAQVRVAELGALACGGGPGSFTSLRIAASIAKGMAVARGIPLLVAPSPLLIVAGSTTPFPAGRYGAVLDAMRGDVFGLTLDVGPAGAISVDGGLWLAPRAAAAARLDSLGGRLVGPTETPPVWPHARGFVALVAAGHALAVDVATWEPDYGRKAEAQVRWEAAHGRPLEVR